MNFAIHAIHILAASIWLGGLTFTLLVVSPAFKRMNWTPPERIAVRSEVGRQYSKIARPNLTILLFALIADWSLHGWSAAGWSELALTVLIIGLAEAHAGIFVPRLARAAREGADELRARLLRISIGVSLLNVLLSIGLVILADLPAS
jgi:putative copper export protein